MHPCPACGYSLDFAPWNGPSASDEMCPCCGIQFGYDDAAGDPQKRQAVYRAWREAWLAGGMRWFSRGQAPPEGWDALDQVRQAGFGKKE